MLPKLVDARLKAIRSAHVEEDLDLRMRREAIAKKLLVASITHPISVTKTAKECIEALKVARKMIDAILFEEEDLLSIAGIRPEDLFDEAERVTSELVGPHSTFSAIHEEKIDATRNVQLKPLFL
ncbi:hypothetical protein BWQ96_08056 [Gracilariopsis chorda]|uniref:Uncharacterized protein n=1 Tax=Gracilariopsis chorda TaxID=448386 RepID=A0A2V3IJK3_9FLOR|nr:hypothetical protein BWQ96_08056 [Gracilariopsis chorda]|eukprot:PXF42228.1 hypothetical protein BWQ96_08056 [Gracilariopsis chorda]